MQNDPIGPAAEGLPTRRRFLTGLARATLALSTAGAAAASHAASGRGAAPLARIVGASDDPERYTSQKFEGPGWYALGHEQDGSSRHVMWAFRDDHPFIALSDGEGLPVAIYVSHRAFDRACRGVLYPAPAGKGCVI